MKRNGRIILALLLLATVSVCLCGCMQNSFTNPKDENAYTNEDLTKEKPKVPDKLSNEPSGMPNLKVYDTSIKEISEMDIETYIMGVVAGEMKNDWPLEALKAQAILARTFVLKFCQDKDSKYDGADISTDVEEAQAYSYENINERIRRAIEETRGLVMSANGELPYAWFHAHAGGMTELPSVSLDFKGKDPEYLLPRDSMESENAPESVKNWTTAFKLEEIIEACRESGIQIEKLDSIEIGEKGVSGRAKTFIINGKSVSAPTFRIKIGANKLKSTLINTIEIKNNEVLFTGRGFGHGVGMSQWGAFALAEDGKNAEEIIEHYFPDVTIAKLW